MSQEQQPEKPKKRVLKTVLHDFISNLEKNTAVERITVSRLHQPAATPISLHISAAYAKGATEHS